MPLVATVESRRRRGTPSGILASQSFLRHLVLAFTVITVSLNSAGCRKKSSVEKQEQPAQLPPERLQVILAAEIGRDARLITNDDLMSRNVELRRRAMQALARTADDIARPALERGLSDDDGEVVTWAAFGLGRACEKGADLAVSQLAVRAVSWSIAKHPPEAASRAALRPMSAIVRALGRCATPLAEATLRNWLRLDSSLADEASIALGTIAAKQHRLESSTLVALLDVADSRSSELPSALFPFTRLTTLEPNVQRRLLLVAAKLVTSKSDARDYAIRALPLGGEAAVPHLERILADAIGYTSQQRSDAARGLARLGEPGQAAIGRALSRLLPRNIAEQHGWLLTEELVLALEMLEQLNHFDTELRPTLEFLAKLAVPSSPSPPIQHRTTLLRCRAASLLAGSLTAAPQLLSCDPEKDGREGALALSRVLGRGPIRARRAPVFDKLAHSNDIVVREHALRWLSSHPEVRDSARILADALVSESPGVVATAASILAEHPERAQGPHSNRSDSSERRQADIDRALHPTPEVLLALGKATHRAWNPDAIDVRAQLIDAVTSVGALSEKAFIEQQCRSNSVVLRQHAESALRNLGDPKRHCAVSKPLTKPASISPSNGPTHVRFHTDIGPLELWLEPKFAPLAATRLLELVNNGFFNGMLVHRVVAGFVVQMGDRSGDGFGGAGLEVLRDELAPLSFRTDDVGLALSGPDTGSSQFFVVLGPHPHLEGEYTRAGRAEGAWNRLVVGDRILRAEIIR